MLMVIFWYSNGFWGLLKKNLEYSAVEKDAACNLPRSTNLHYIFQENQISYSKSSYTVKNSLGCLQKKLDPFFKSILFNKFCQGLVLINNFQLCL